MHPEAELSLIKQAANGDHHAFRLLVESYQRFAYALAYRFTGNEDDAEDIVQDAFIKVWKNLGRYNPEFKLKSWLGKIVTNLCLDHIRSKKRKGNDTRTKTSDVLMIPNRIDHEIELEQRELLSIVTGLANALTEKQQAVFVLRDLQQLTTEEVCEILGMNPGTMKSNLYYARLNIRAGLERYYRTKEPKQSDAYQKTRET